MFNRDEVTGSVIGTSLTSVIPWRVGLARHAYWRARRPSARARYTARIGIDCDRAAVHCRCVITTSLAVSCGGARGWAPYLLVAARCLDGLATRMPALMGISETPDLAQVGETPRTSYFDGIRQAVRSVEEVEIREQTRNLLIFVHYL